MDNSEEFFSTLSRSAVRTAGESIFDNQPLAPGKQSADDRLMIIILGILVFVGREAVNVVFRRNFGAAGINVPRLILCSILFTSISVLAFFQVDSTDEFATETGTSDSHFITGMLYIIMALYVLIKGIVHRTKAIKNGNFSNYRGDSYLLGFLKKDGWKQQTIQNMAEPLLTLAIGSCLCFYDLLAGIPLIFCAVSVWGYFLMQWLFMGNNMQHNVENINRQHQQPDHFNEIKSL
jgi:hypothetical protein